MVLPFPLSSFLYYSIEYLMNIDSLILIYSQGRVVNEVDTCAFAQNYFLDENKHPIKCNIREGNGFI